MPGHRLTFEPVKLPAATVELRRRIRAFLAEELSVKTFTTQCDSWLGGFSPEFSRRLAAQGFIGMTLPRRYGGSERSALDRFVAVEELLAVGAPVAAHWITDRQTGPLLVRYGTEEQKNLFLPRIARAEIFFAIGMSEPDSGSDLASIRSAARRDGGGWAITGRKIWTSHANRCQYMVALVRTSPAAHDRHEGLSQMIIDLSAPGVSINPIRLMTGDQHFSEVVLEDVPVPDSMVVGDVGRGWQQVISELAFERSGPERFMSTFPLFVELVAALGPTPGDREAEVVGRLFSQIVALRRLSLSVAAAIDQGAAPAVEAALVKELGTRFEREVTEAARLLIEQDVRPPAMAARLAEAVLHGPGFTLRGGTNEILRGVLAKAVTGA